MAAPPRTNRNLPAFHAPPPSPVGRPGKIPQFLSGDDDFSGFLKRSRRVPELILPHWIYPREAAAPWSPPVINFRSLVSPVKEGSDETAIIRSAARSLGCFQIVNHGVEERAVLAAIEAAEGVFGLEPERKKLAARSPEKRLGFEVVDGEDSGDGDEFFWWSWGAEEILAGVLDQQYSIFSGKMKHLCGKMRKIAREIQHVLMENSIKQYETNNSHGWRSDAEEMVACIRKHKRRGEAFIEEDGFAGGDLNHDMLGAALRSLGSPHALALHLFAGASSFRVYSKLSPALFPPADAAILVTVGDQMQESSGGAYRHVIGKPEYQFSEARREPISIAFLHSYPAVSRPAVAFSGAPGIGRDEHNTISLSQQLVFVAFLLFIYHIVAYVYFGKV